MIKNLWPIWVMLFYFFFCIIIRFNLFFCRFIILLHLISSFSFIRTFLLLYASVSIESFYCIFLLSFKLKAILLISSVKRLSLSLLNLSCVLNINLSFFMNSLRSVLRLSTLIFFFSK